MRSRSGDMIRQYFKEEEKKLVIDFSLSRVVKHMETMGFTVLSPFKENKLKDPKIEAENWKNWSKLLSKLKDSGYGWFQSWGQYKYKGMEKASREKIVLIPNKPIPGEEDKAQDLKSFVIDLLREFDQDSALWVEDGKANFLDRTGKVESIGKFTANKLAEYLTIIKMGKGGKPKTWFSYEVGDMIKQPDNHIDAMFYDFNKIYYGVVEDIEGRFVEFSHFGKWGKE